MLATFKHGADLAALASAFLFSVGGIMSQQYIESIDDSYRIAGTRVSLDSIVHAYWSGQTAEAIAQSFPGLTLEQVHGALAFYLAHRSEIDARLERAEAEFEALRDASQRQDPMFYQKLANARAAGHASRP
jgi:uncharacterized protein (DUF433 family)